MDSGDESLLGLQILDSPMEREIYGMDQAEVPPELRRAFVRGTPELVVQPRNEEEIERVLRYAEIQGLPVVPRGAASSPYGGAVPAKGGVVLDLSLMRTVLALDRQTGVVAVEAGVRWADLDEFLRGNDYSVMAHPSSWFSTVAGWLSTGGYGLYSLRFGPFWSQLEWIRVVDFKGVRTVLREAPEFQYYVHTEGQMGIISQVGLRVRSRPKLQLPLLFTFQTALEAVSMGQAIATRFKPVHMTYYDPSRLGEFNELHGREVLERAHSILVVVEEENEAEALTSYVAGKGERAEHYRASYLWEHRLFPMQVKKLGPGLLGAEFLMKVPLIPGYMRRARELASRFDVNLSHEVHYVRPDEGLVISSFLTDQRVLQRYLPHLALVLLLTKLGVRTGGRAYGIGVWNRPFLRTRYSRHQVAALKRYKRRVDPKGLLNPGKAFGDAPGLLRPWMIALPLMNPLVLRAVARGLSWKRPSRPSKELARAQEDLRSAAECAHCSACITVCPAYLADRTELVTARGKLMALERLMAGQGLGEEDALKLFDCIHCSACTNVCQSGIDLVPMWDRLEAAVAQRHGKPLAQIEDFARRVEEEPEYHELVRKGLAYPLQTPIGSYKRV